MESVTPNPNALYTVRPNNLALTLVISDMCDTGDLNRSLVFIPVIIFNSWVARECESVRWTEKQISIISVS